MAIFIFDCNSHFSRCFKVAVKDGHPDPSIIANHQGTHPAFYNGQPVFTLPRVLNIVRNEIRDMTKLGFVMTHIVLVFDAPGKNFRHEMYPPYKSGRPEKSDSERYQLAQSIKMFENQGFPVLQIPGVESDDVIGTICDKLERAPIEVVIGTRDKDMLSEVNEKTYVYSGADKKLYREADVLEKMGVIPDKVHDLLSLTGDTIDGFNGVPGVGASKAPIILNHMTFKQMQMQPELLLDIDLKGKQRIYEYVKNNPIEMETMRKLAVLKRDVELNKNLKEFTMSSPTVSNIYHGIQ